MNLGELIANLRACGEAHGYGLPVRFATSPTDNGRGVVSVYVVTPKEAHQKKDPNLAGVWVDIWPMP